MKKLIVCSLPGCCCLTQEIESELLLYTAVVHFIRNKINVAILRNA